MNGAPPSECGGGEEDAGASYVELGQGGQEVMMVMSMMVMIMMVMIMMVMIKIVMMMKMLMMAKMIRMLVLC